MRPPARTPELGLICESRAMPRFATEHEHVAPSDVSVLIWGEPGVGKERAARALHERSSRGRQPLEVIRCSGLDGAALQAALADVLPRARSGSVLLDGVEELRADAQVELLLCCSRRLHGRHPSPRRATSGRSLAGSATRPRIWSRWCGAVVCAGICTIA